MIPPADVALLTEFMKNFASIRPTATAILMGAVIFAFAPGVRPLLRAQTGQTGQTATQSLLDKAHALEVRGRMDMAAQTWQQVLLADPENATALAGVGPSAKPRGKGALGGHHLGRLRGINP